MIKKLAYKIRPFTSKRIRKLIYKVGLIMHEKAPYPSMESTLNDLKQRGFTPSTVIDVGAYHGEWTTMFKKIFPSCRVLMIEAQKEKLPALNGVCEKFSGAVSCEIALLGAKTGAEVDFVQMETGSSVFEESSPYARKRLKKTLITLDALLEGYKDFQQVDFLKLDVQGYELEILKGASALLKRTKFVLMETSFIPINKGCPLILEVITFMDSMGFRAMDFCSQVRRKDGSLWATDFLFVSTRSSFLPNPQLDETNWEITKGAHELLQQGVNGQTEP
jgi:FkbM family methyltransferase